MNILYFLDGFPKISETFILNEIYALDQRGHDIAVFALTNPNDEFKHDEFEELDIHLGYANQPGFGDLPDLVSTEVIRPGVLKRALFRGSPKQHGLALHLATQCLDFIGRLELDIDLVHTHYATIHTHPARYVGANIGSPVTTTTHAFDLYNRPNVHQLRHFLASSDHVVTVSDYNREYILNELTDRTPVSTVHAGIRPEKFCPGNAVTADHRLLTVSRFVEKKGIPYAIRAVAQLVDRFPDIEYHIIGSGPMKSALRETVTDYGISEYVTILNNVSDEQLQREYDEAACFLLPCVIAESGNRDGIPVAMMEAMAMESPPVSTTISGIPELVDHQDNGLLVAPEDVDELAEAIGSLLNDPNRRRRFGRAGRQKVVDKFNVEREVVKLERIFSSVVEQREVGGY